MKIELKNINRSPKIAGAFMAFLYIDGKKAGLVWNRGKGCLTNYHHVGIRGAGLIAAAEREYKLMQPEKSTAAWPQPLAPLLEKLLRDSGKKIRKNRSRRP